jgi:hypothetical protein
LFPDLCCWGSAFAGRSAASFQQPNFIGCGPQIEQAEAMTPFLSEVVKIERLGTYERDKLVQSHPGFVFGIRTRDLGASAGYQASRHKNVPLPFFPTHYQLEYRMEAAEREGIRN